MIFFMSINVSQILKETRDNRKNDQCRTVANIKALLGYLETTYKDTGIATDANGVRQALDRQLRKSESMTSVEALWFTSQLANIMQALYEQQKSRDARMIQQLIGVVITKV